MFEHERFALTTYGLNNQLDTLEWTLETIPAGQHWVHRDVAGQNGENSYSYDVCE